MAPDAAQGGMHFLAQLDMVSKRCPLDCGNSTDFFSFPVACGRSLRLFTLHAD